MYKRFEPRLERNLHLASDFEQHIRFLKKFRIKPLSLFNESPSSKDVFITFDDGYANNLLAAELLAKHRIPWTLFISTNAIGKDKTIWTVELSLLLLKGNAVKLELFEKKWDLGLKEQREQAFQEIRIALKKLPADMKNKFIKDIRDQFPKGETQRLLAAFPSFKMLAWDEVRQLAAAGVEIGSHGVDHEIHQENQPAVIRIRELIDSKREIEKQLERPCKFFAYPNGNYSLTSPEEVRVAGYDMAFTTEQNMISNETNSYLIPRLEVISGIEKFAQNFYWQAK